MQIFHISEQRFNAIRDQGHRLIVPELALKEIDVAYHLIDGDHATCNECGIEVDSVTAKTPVELEIAKRNQ